MPAMITGVVISAVTLLPFAGASFTNAKITQCARDARANGSAWLTANSAAYICTDAQWDKYYDPASSIAPFLLNDDATAPAQAACPKKGQVIKCFIFASWGQVAGGPDACGDSCSTQMGTGSGSCCAKACTSDGSFDSTFPPSPSPSSANCTNNKWKTDTTATCGARGEGYCDCCPNCYSCVHGPPPPSPAPTGFRSYVANRFCDCRKGLEVSPDYSPCWNSCLDCFGDDGQVDYMPEDIAKTCVGKNSCYVFADYTSKHWQSCTSSAKSSCSSSSQAAKDLPNQPKAKGMVLCGSPDDEADVVV